MIQFNDNIGNQTPKAIDNRHGKFVFGAWEPYETVDEANSNIIQAYRHKGLTILIKEGGIPVEYWYENGVGDSDLTRKNIPTLSQEPGNAATLLNSQLYVPNTLQYGIVYGGIVSWVSGYTFHVSAAGYFINRVFYTSPETIVTLSDPDSTENRIDVFGVNDQGSVIVIEGTPSASPSEPTSDPTTQVKLSLVLVETGTTEPTSLNTECAYKTGSEWDIFTSNSTRVNPTSSSAPCGASIGIEGTNVQNNDYLILTRSATFDPRDDFNIITFNIRSKGYWGGKNGTRKITLQWRLAGIDVGLPIIISDGSFGFDSTNTTDCQVIAIPLTQFTLPTSTSVDELVIKAVLNNGYIGFYMDNICFQGMPTTESSAQNITLTTTGTGAATLVDNVLNIPVVAPTLSDVLNNGNSSSSLAILGQLMIRDASTSEQLLLTGITVGSQHGGALILKDSNSAFTGRLEPSGTLSADRTYLLPNASGTIALTSNIVAFGIDAVLAVGQALTANRTVTGGSFYTTFNTTGTSAALSATNSNVSSTSGGLYGYSNGGYGLSAETVTGIAGLFTATPATTSTVHNLLSIERKTSGSPIANGIGSSIAFKHQTLGGSGAPILANELISKWTTATSGSQVSQFIITGVNNAVTADKFIIKGTGVINIPTALGNYTDNTAATGAGLVAGDIYRNGDVLMIVH